ncbi:MAG: DUF4012 domain-containing protein [Chloroflexi bacterium]|nr:DUF4012 domain-containing protein [Chloroflexota bacterium]
MRDPATGIPGERRRDAWRPYPFARGRRAVAIATAASLVVVIAIWLVVSAIGTAVEASGLRNLLAPINSADSASGPVATGATAAAAGSAFDRVGDRLDQASGRIGRIKAYSVPFRLAPSLWGLLPVRGGDLSQLPRVIDYAGPTLVAARDLYDLADGARLVVSRGGASEASGNGPPSGIGASTVQAAASYAVANRDRLTESRDRLRVAAAIAQEVDRARLSPGVAVAFDTVETLRDAATTIVDVVIELEPAITGADRILTALRGTPGTVAPSEVSADNAEGRAGGATKQNTGGLAVDLGPIVEAASAFPRTADRLRGPAATIAPYAGRDPAEAQAILDYAARLSGPIAALLKSALDAGDLLGGGLPDDPESAAQLEGLLRAIEANASEAASIASTSELSGIAESLLDTASDRLRRIELAAVVARDLLGYDGGRTILVLGQDDEELRPSGGFIGSVWELEFERGQMAGSQVQSSYFVDEPIPLTDWMRAPGGFALSFDADVMPFRDQNWWPDFAYSAARLRETYERGQGARPHAIIAVNQHSLKAVLSATGPIQVSDGYAVDAQGLREFLREGIAPPGASVGPDLDPRRYAARLLGAGIIRRLVEGGGIDLTRLALNVSSTASDGDLLIEIGSEPGRSALRVLGWDGRLHPFSGDGWYWVDSNAYAGKISQDIVRAVHQRVEIAADGTSLDTLTVRYTNPFGGPGDCVQPASSTTPPCYWLFGRLLLPLRTELVDAPRFDIPPGAAGAQRALRGTQSNSSDAGAIREHLEAAALAAVPPGSNTEWTYTYRVPAASRQTEDGKWRYASRIERQPGMPPVEVVIEVSAPERACIVAIDGTSRSPITRATIAWPLTRDRDLTVDYTFDSDKCRP